MATAKKSVRKAATSSATRAAKSPPKKASKKADGESAVLAKIAAMPGANRTMGERLHALIKATAPELAPTLWFGLPAYARDGKMLCFFRSGHTFKERYMTFGFSDKAQLDDGGMWPIYYALKQLTATEEAAIGALLKKALT